MSMLQEVIARPSLRSLCRWRLLVTTYETRFTTDGKHIPPELLSKIQELGKRYVFEEHVAPGSANCRLIEELGLVDFLADRFAIAGTQADCIRKIEAAAEAGGTRDFWIGLHFKDKIQFLRDWSAEDRSCIQMTVSYSAVILSA